MTGNSTKRFNSIDSLRGLAIILMFFHHFPRWLMIDPGQSQLYGLMFIASRFSAPMFLFIVGISLVLSAQRRMIKQGHMDVLKHFLKRGFFLVLAGFLLNILIPKDILDINILHTIGLSIIILAPLSIRPSRVNCLVATLVLIPVSEMAYRSTPVRSVMDMFQFPVLPWMVFVVFGIAVGGLLTDLYGRSRVNKFPRYLEFSAILFGVAACAMAELGFSFDYKAYCTGPFIAMVTGMILYIMAVFFWIYDVYEKNPAPLRPLVVYGRFALSIYFVQYVFVATIPTLLGFRNTFSEAGSTVSLGAFLIITWLVLRGMVPKGKPVPTDISDKPQH